MPSPVPDHFDLAVLANDLDHVEGVCWDPVRRCLWAGGEAGQVYRVEVDGAVTLLTTIDGGRLLGIALDGLGRLYVCDPGNHQLWRVEASGAYAAYGEPIAYPNYAAFAADGRLFVSDSGSFDEATGQIVVIDRAVTTRLETRPIGFANGLCLDGETLWVVEASAPGVSALDLTTGVLTPVVEMERCVPDGLARDVAGGLLISCYQPNQLWRWTKEEGLELLLDDWTGEYVLSPTNVAFYGDDLSRLALASLCGNQINTVAPPHRGVAPHYPKGE